jgi:hypothetical protein
LWGGLECPAFFRQVLAKICFRKLTKAVFADTFKQPITSFERLNQKVSSSNDLELSWCTLSVAKNLACSVLIEIRVRFNVSSV